MDTAIHKVKYERRRKSKLGLTIELTFSHLEMIRWRSRRRCAWKTSCFSANGSMPYLQTIWIRPLESSRENQVGRHSSRRTQHSFIGWVIRFIEQRRISQSFPIDIGSDEVRISTGEIIRQGTEHLDASPLLLHANVCFDVAKHERIWSDQLE